MAIPIGSFGNNSAVGGQINAKLLPEFESRYPRNGSRSSSVSCGPS